MKTWWWHVRGERWHVQGERWQEPFFFCGRWGVRLFLFSSGLLSAHVERCSVSHVWDFFYIGLFHNYSLQKICMNIPKTIHSWRFSQIFQIHFCQTVGPTKQKPYIHKLCCINLHLSQWLIYNCQREILTTFYKERTQNILI